MSVSRTFRHAVLARSPMLMTLARKIKGIDDSPLEMRATQPMAQSEPVIPKPAAVDSSLRVQRTIGVSQDKRSRGINAFSLIETCGVAYVTDTAETIAELFNRYGLVKVRGVYSAKLSKVLNEHCIDFSGLRPLDIRDVFAGRKKWVTGGSPVLSDDRFWPYAAEPKVKELIKTLLGENAFEFKTAVAAHYSGRALHRDCRMLVENDYSEYNFHNPKKRVVRVFHYGGAMGGALGYIPFSFNESLFEQQSKRIGLNRPTEWFNRHRQVLEQAHVANSFAELDDLERHICWVHADPGDIVVCNSAMLQCDEHLTGARYFFASTYAESNDETLEVATSGAKDKQRALAYHRFMVEQGFNGSADLLKAVGAA